MNDYVSVIECSCSCSSRKRNNKTAAVAAEKARIDKCLNKGMDDDD